MKVRVQPRPQSIEQARAELSRRLEARRDEIEAAVMTRVYSVSDTKDLDPTYAEGLKAAITAAVDYGFAAIALGEERSSPPPPILLTQARLAARAGVSLDTVLRRYFAGHTLLADYLVEEAEGGRLLRGAALQRLLRTQAALFDRLLVAVSEEYGREDKNRLGTGEQQRSERVERLLAGELVDTSGLGYEFDGWHLGLVGLGATIEKTIRELARSLDYQLLCVRRDEDTFWAWLGGRTTLDAEALKGSLDVRKPADTWVALGEPAMGIDGWRLTHRQAQAALSIALRSRAGMARYADVASLASMLQDDLLVTSLRELYLAPLMRERDGGETLRKTLSAYFAADRNVSSAAAVLGINRHTVTSRLRAVEGRLGRPLGPWVAADLEAALRLEELTNS